MTTEQIFKSLTHAPYTEYNYKFGFNGSDGHSIFHQAGNLNTNNMILAMFCPLRLTIIDSTLVWEINRPNSPLSRKNYFYKLERNHTNPCTH